MTRNTGPVCHDSITEQVILYGKKYRLTSQTSQIEIRWPTWPVKNDRSLYIRLVFFFLYCIM